jgi:hypothetical protein
MQLTLTSWLSGGGRNNHGRSDSAVSLDMAKQTPLTDIPLEEPLNRLSYIRNMEGRRQAWNVYKLRHNH